jgi:uncharacterized protein YjiS (DUF1127 family)
MLCIEYRNFPYPSRKRNLAVSPPWPTPMTCPLLSEMLHWFAAAPQSRWRQIEILQELDDRRLADLGISRGEALRGRRDSSRAAALTERPNRPCPITAPLP